MSSQLVDLVMHHIDPSVSISLIFNLRLSGLARLCRSFGVPARQGAATA